MTTRSWSSPIRATVSEASPREPAPAVFPSATSCMQIAYMFAVLMHIISQLRPGADLSRVVLPTFILEPRSMLERITK